MPPGLPSARRVLFASLVGTTIEFYDFYIFATAAVLVFPKLFFPPGDPTSALLQSLATFAVAFFARPVGSALFGHFGDRLGRKTTLVASLLTMGLSTAFIGLLPTYDSIGLLAPVLLVLLRVGQGLGLGGEWGGAVLLATEHAPPGKRGWYGMFPQLGAPIGFFASTATFLALTLLLEPSEFLAWGWRVPFVASAVLVLVGLYVRLQLTETPAFQRALERRETVRVPVAAVLTRHPRELVLGTLVAMAVFALFYLMTVFTLSWGTSALGFTRQQFLWLQLGAVLSFAITIPLSALYADRVGTRRALALSAATIVAYGLSFGPLFGIGSAFTAFLSMAIGLATMGLMYGPLGTALAELFPTAVRYTGASLAFNLAGILGGSVAPYVATTLANDYGLSAVGWYLAVVAGTSLVAIGFLRSPPARP